MKNKADKIIDIKCDVKDYIPVGKFGDDLPVVFIKAKDRKDAKEQLLYLNSRYGRITEKGLFEFLNEPGLTLDFDEIKKNLDLPELDLLLFSRKHYSKAKGNINAIPAPPKKALSKRGDLFLINGRHRMLCGDSTDKKDVELLLDGKEFKTIVSSPPYFLERSYEKEFTVEKAEVLLSGVASLWINYCLPGGYFFDDFANIGSFAFAKAWTGIDHCEFPASVLHYNIFKDAGWRLHTQRIWEKPHAMCVGQHVLTSNRAVFSWEYLWTWRKGTGKEKVGDSDLRSRGVWDTSKVDEIHHLKDLGHDASFPVVLPMWALRVYSSENDIIADPFLGTGTTMIAAEELNRNSYGMELLPIWIDVALMRFHNLYPESKIECLNRNFNFKKLFNEKK